MPRRKAQRYTEEIEEVRRRWEARAKELAAAPPPVDIFDDFDGWLERSNKELAEAVKAFEDEYYALKFHAGTKH